jgi:hypothetical protein
MSENKTRSTKTRKNAAHIPKPGKFGPGDTKNGTRGTKTRKKGTKARKSTKRCEWEPIFLVRIYRMVRLGMLDIDIENELGVSHAGYYYWKQTIPELQQAITMAEKERESGETLSDWIFSKLSPQLKEIWQKIGRLEKRKDGVSLIQNMLSEEGKLVKQELFLYALCSHDFSMTRALKKVGVSKRELDSWIQSDPGFSDLVEEMQWHKGNFFEESLMRLVRAGNPAAIVFANRSFNKERGYGTSTQVDVNVRGQVMHGIVDLGEIMSSLSEACQIELLHALRDREKKEKIVLDPHERMQREILEGSARLGMSEGEKKCSDSTSGGAEVLDQDS